MPPLTVTCVMPEPISPPPNTPTFLISTGGTPAGRPAPFSAACLLMNKVRIMFFAWLPESSFVKYLDSTRSAVSNGRMEPSYKQDKMALIASKLPLLSLCAIAFRPTNNCTARGSIAPAPPGNLKSFLSQGAVTFGLAFTHALALAIRSAAGATSCTNPCAFAVAGSSALP